MNDQPLGSDFIQASRVIKISSPLGENVLLPERARVTEGVNKLFEIKVSVRSKQDIAPADLIGKLVDVELEVQQGEDAEAAVHRCWNGLVTELHEGPSVTRGLRSYQLVLRPSLWLLSQTRDSRIWMDQTAIDVLDTLMQEHGLKHADTSGVLSPKPLHYSCQFNESDLRYLFRRFEEDGYFWWFTHRKGAHTLHLVNHTSGWLDPSDAAQGEGRVRLARGSSNQNHIREWMRRFSYVPGSRTGADWNYKTFGTIPQNTTPSLVDLPGNDRREVFEWPARAMMHDEAEQVEKLRSQASEADHERVTGASTVRVLEPGRRFTPYDVANPDALYEEHVIVSAEHVIIDRSYETDSSTEPEYRNTFEAIPSRVPLTPHRTTPKPKIEGLQVAVVAGPEGEEIHCDPDGCVKLWFPWQRHRARKDGSDTKWVRVATNWAGQGWGGQVIPRIGMEVLTAFLDSDPDRPIVVGLVPNPKNRVPYQLPANKTKSVFRTNTHKGTGFNELTFEDERNREEIYLHAQKDFTAKVENHATERVDANKIVSVGGMSLTEVERSSTQNIAQNLSINVGTGSFGNLISGEARRDPFGMRPAGYFLSHSLEQAVGRGNLSIDAANSIRINTTSAYSIEVSGVYLTTVGAAYTVNVGGAAFISTGQDSREVVAKKKMIDAHGEIHFRCGKSEILMQPDGTITMKGVKLIVQEEEHIDMKAARIDLNS
jgi:type VI secretion system secreted protein VgrG